MTTAKWTITTGAQQELRYPAACELMRRGVCLQVWGGDALSV
jgi:hypothetical protein